MFWFKTCPKCHGDLTSDKDIYGRYVACIQCGHYLSPAEESRLGAVTDRAELRPLVAVGQSRLAA